MLFYNIFKKNAIKIIMKLFASLRILVLVILAVSFLIGFLIRDTRAMVKEVIRLIVTTKYKA